MKMVITESRVESVALKYMKNELGEFQPTTESNGLFIKDGSVTAGIYEYDIHILDDIYYPFKSMFDFQWIKAN